MITTNIPILAIKSFKTAGGGGGTTGVKDVNYSEQGHLIVTYADGRIVDKGELGDMYRSIYDTDNSGIVDNSEKVNGYAVNANVPADVNDRVKATVNDETLSLLK